MNQLIEREVVEDIKRVFNLQKENQYKVGNSSAKERIAKLKALKKAIEVTYRNEIREAMYSDFQKPQAEVDLSEVFPVTSEIKHTISHLRQWMADQPVATPLSLLGSSSYIRYEPKGVCLIIAPWNFPINLTLGPLVSAIAAGNTAIVKPSEFTPATSAIISKLIKNTFAENEIAVIEGGIEESQQLLSLPFNHIFFTGAPAIGKIVMEAAAKNLTSVTLELGGKSPTIIDETANIHTAAKRIAWGKFFNCGQICIAPDYILVHESKKAALVEALKNQLTKFYGENPETSASYPKIVNTKHTKRIASYLDDAISKGANVIVGGKSEATESYLSPTLIENVAMDSALMENEIFGPILPILTFSTLEEAVQLVNKGEKPLALYIYSKSNKNIDFVIKNTRAGNSCINNNDLHFFNPNLPFGGSNNSGIGKAHGIFGFQAFSEARGIYRQHIPSTLELLLLPPYTNFKEKLVSLIVKLF